MKLLRGLKLIPPVKCFRWRATPLQAMPNISKPKPRFCRATLLRVEVIRKLHLDQNPELVGKIKPSDSAAASVPEPNTGGPQLTLREKLALR